MSTSARRIAFDATPLPALLATYTLLSVLSCGAWLSAAHPSHRTRSEGDYHMLRTQIPVEADLDNMEALTNLMPNEYVLSLVLHHYFSLRLGGIDDTPGVTPRIAMAKTLDWAESQQYLQSVA